MEMETESDSALVALAQSGNTLAFGQLYERHGSRVRLIAKRITRNPTAAEDILQDVFVTAHVFLGQFPSGASFNTWLLELAIAHLNRYVAVERTHLGLSIETITESDDGAPPLNEIPLADVAMTLFPEHLLLDQALATISASEREMVLMHGFHELSYAEIGAVLGIDQRTVRTRMHRAYMTMRTRFAC